MFFSAVSAVSAVKPDFGERKACKARKEEFLATKDTKHLSWGLGTGDWGTRD